MTTVVAGCLLAAVLAVAVPGRRLPVRRLASLATPGLTRPAGDGAGPDAVPSARAVPGEELSAQAPRSGVRRLVSTRDPVRWGAGLAGAAVAVMAEGWFGVLAGAVTAVVLDRVLRRLEPAARRRQRLAEAAALPLAADLLAVTIRGGVPVDRATRAVAEAVPGPLGERLGRVGRALSLGSTPSEAWAELAPVPGAERLVRAAVRSAEHGSALAAALGRLADDLRADRAIAADAAARRAAVLIVLPLGLCFLPAFVLAGLVPVIIAVLGDVL